MKNLLAIVAVSLLLVIGCKKSEDETMDFTMEIYNESSLSFKGGIYNSDGTSIETYSGSESYWSKNKSIPLSDLVKVEFTFSGSIDSTSKDKIKVIANGIEFKASKIDTVRVVGSGGSTMQPCLLIRGTITKK